MAFAGFGGAASAISSGATLTFGLDAGFGWTGASAGVSATNFFVAFGSDETMACGDTTGTCSSATGGCTMAISAGASAGSEGVA